MTPRPLEIRIFTVATAALLAEPVDVAHTGAFLRDFDARAPWHVVAGLRIVLLLTLLSPLLILGRVRSFLSVGDDARAEIWRRALEHRSYAVRQLALVLKALACMCRFDDDAPPVSIGDAR